MREASFVVLWLCLGRYLVTSFLDTSVIWLHDLFDYSDFLVTRLLIELLYILHCPPKPWRRRDKVDVIMRLPNQAQVAIGL